jgi:acid stress chaperone HdeB
VRLGFLPSTTPDRPGEGTGDYRAQETEMSRLIQAWVALSLSAFAVVPAHAQVTIDVSKITCEQYILFTVADPKDIAMWLSGYYNGKRNNTVIDTQEFREAGKKVMDYCQLNLKTTVMDAVEKVLGVKR